MKYYLSEKILYTYNKKNAGNKARDDVNEILTKEGYSPLKVSISDLDKLSTLKSHKKKYDTLKSAFSVLKPNDEVVIQFPLIYHTIFLPRLLTALNRKNVRVKFLIHDLESLRILSSDSKITLKQRIRLNIQEKFSLNKADKVIVHNTKMQQTLIERGFSPDNLVTLEIFDYLIPHFDLDKTKKNFSKTFIVAGNLIKSKSGYLYNLPENIDCNLYGVGYDEKAGSQNISYKGSFLPDELPSELEGAFGLVWDGPESTTCSGVFGQYLKYNNSHKASLYLASEFPLVVWKQSAMADFVLKNECGIVVESLYDLSDKIDTMSSKEYEKLIDNAKVVGEKIREGHYLSSALKQ